MCKGRILDAGPYAVVLGTLLTEEVYSDKLTETGDLLQ